MRNNHTRQAKGLWRNLILLWHMPLHGYRKYLNSAYKVDILVGYITGKVKQF